MDDQGYIKKAVELADGWEKRGDTWYGPWLVCFKEHEFDKLQDDFWRPLLDALAAQLVRQVDALDFPVMVICSKDACSIVEPDETYNGPVTTEGRTMNTIKAIVDSGVLG